MPDLIIPYRGRWPKIAPTAFIAPNAAIVGDVEIGDAVSVWFSAVIRGDSNAVVIGPRTNIQDGTVVHTNQNGGPTRIGADVTIGHMALIHGCVLEDECFIAMGAVILDGAVVERGAMVAAGSLVPPGKRVPAGEIWAGNPARFWQKVTKERAEKMAYAAHHYVKTRDEYADYSQLARTKA
ncbi:MAG: gamma carbonic anhydrase family protein [Alphaproteobacteria bacterium]